MVVGSSSTVGDRLTRPYVVEPGNPMPKMAGGRSCSQGVEKGGHRSQRVPRNCSSQLKQTTHPRSSGIP